MSVHRECKWCDWAGVVTVVFEPEVESWFCPGCDEEHVTAYAPPFDTFEEKYGLR